MQSEWTKKWRNDRGNIQGLDCSATFHCVSTTQGLILTDLAGHQHSTAHLTSNYVDNPSSLILHCILMYKSRTVQYSQKNDVVCKIDVMFHFLFVGSQWGWFWNIVQYIIFRDVNALEDKLMYIFVIETFPYILDPH